MMRVMMIVAVTMCMAVISRVGMAVAMSMSFSHLLPCTDKHPHRQAQHHGSGGDMKIRLRSLRIPVVAIVQCQCGEHPDDQGMGDGCRKPQQHRLPDSAPHGDDERCHHRFGVPWLQPVQGSKKHCYGQVKPDMAAAGLNELLEIGHKDERTASMLTSHRMPHLSPWGLIQELPDRPAWRAAHGGPGLLAAPAVPGPPSDRAPAAGTALERCC